MSTPLTTRCPLCETEQPARRVGEYTFVECSACGDFAYDRQSAAALRAEEKLRGYALSHVESSARIWPDRVACFRWMGELRFAWLTRP